MNLGPTLHSWGFEFWVSFPSSLFVVVLCSNVIAPCWYNFVLTLFLLLLLFCSNTIVLLLLCYPNFIIPCWYCIVIITSSLFLFHFNAIVLIAIATLFWCHCSLLFQGHCFLLLPCCFKCHHLVLLIYSNAIAFG